MKEEKKRLSDYDQSGRLGVTEMIGAIIFMVFGGFKKKYDYYSKIKYQKRNIIVGYIAGILLFATIFYFFLLI